MTIKKQFSTFIKASTTQVLLLFWLLPVLYLIALAHSAATAFATGDFFYLVKYGLFYFTVGLPVVVGFVSVLALMLAYLHGLDRKLYVLGAAGIVFALLSVGVRYYATEVEPYALEIREVVIRSDKISQPVRILHVTDIQSAAIGAYEKRVFHVIRQLDPDLILNTGDNLQPIAPATLDTEMPKLWALFDTLTPLLGKYCIYGNVWDRDLYPRDPRLGGQTLLDNTSVVIPTPGGTLHVLGLGLQASRHPGPVIQDWFAALPEPAFGIVMGHRPDYVLSCVDLPIDLCLAGHVHGGQIVIPGFGPLVTFSALPRDKIIGMHAYGRTQINVSKGVGAEHHLDLPSLRLFCPPDITVIHVVPQIHVDVVK
jgi:uncharacterized protein